MQSDPASQYPFTYLSTFGDGTPNPMSVNLTKFTFVFVNNVDAVE